ncbi:MerR family transcriptional regulator [Liquorilactobacillus satsumensis]|uniref:HTH merR-type domain-containing protein n=2 Tax=Liquorilactobacillus TaxID=2767888 RepID=A0A0R1UWG9_9LACO|nr:MerR family transcriptional regulator [Liquorilactobacillus satsumensis]KRL97569.1 hypothetical protein FD50_GL001323 [Liquorilactobacillus satsumensis DSM 16230 = JCM 12392]MCP9313503.1 MerR family transcriptional regulator [Liquorilactobacillus satsumensis]MCP9329528.1 MerR family transcriptional regulator [Liquorilactobacillus satsumensis]MCP9360672.1 MerR family transcriptional regulator [Liquorilactobacillus satsumensis]
MTTYKIGEVTKITHLSADTIRFYEKKDLCKIKRDSNGQRIFDENDLEWLYFIQQLKAVKMELNQIKEYGKLKRVGTKTLPQRIDFLYQHQAKLIAQQKNLAEIIKKMEEKIKKTKKKMT